MWLTARLLWREFEHDFIHSTAARSPRPPRRRSRCLGHWGRRSLLQHGAPRLSDRLVLQHPRRHHSLLLFGLCRQHLAGLYASLVDAESGRVGAHLHYVDRRHLNPRMGAYRLSPARYHQRHLLRHAREQLGRTPPPTHSRLDHPPPRLRPDQKLLRRRAAGAGHPLGAVAVPAGVVDTFRTSTLRSDDFHCGCLAQTVDRKRAPNFPAGPAAHRHAPRRRSAPRITQRLFQKSADVDRLCHTRPHPERQWPQSLFSLLPPRRSRYLSPALPRQYPDSAPAQLPDAGLFLLRQPRHSLWAVLLLSAQHRPAGHLQRTRRPEDRSGARSL